MLYSEMIAGGDLAFAKMKSEFQHNHGFVTMLRAPRPYESLQYILKIQYISVCKRFSIAFSLMP